MIYEGLGVMRSLGPFTFFLAVFFCVMHHGLSERETRSLAPLWHLSFFNCVVVFCKLPSFNCNKL